MGIGSRVKVCEIGLNGDVRVRARVTANIRVRTTANVRVGL